MVESILPSSLLEPQNIVIVVCCLAAVIVVFLLIWFLIYFLRLKKTAEPAEVDETAIVKLEENASVYKQHSHGASLNRGLSLRIKSPEQIKADRLELLGEAVTDPNLQFIFALEEAAKVSQLDYLLPHVVRIIEYADLASHTLQQVFENETKKTASTGTLFRGESLATKYSKHYIMFLNEQTDSAYLKEIIMPLIERVVSDADERGISYEDKLSEDDDVTKNAERLIETCQAFVNRIFMASDKVPAGQRLLLSKVGSAVSKRFESDSVTLFSIGGFVFLRHICPFIVMGAGAGVSAGAKRNLVLVSKILQNLSNGIAFGEKEPYMVPANTFITRNMGACRRFLRNIALPIDDPVDTGLAVLPDERRNALDKLRVECEPIRDKIGECIKDEEFKSVVIKALSDLPKSKMRDAMFSAKRKITRDKKVQEKEKGKNEKEKGKGKKEEEKAGDDPLELEDLVMKDKEKADMLVL